MQILDIKNDFFHPPFFFFYIKTSAIVIIKVSDLVSGLFDESSFTFDIIDEEEPLQGVNFEV